MTKQTQTKWALGVLAFVITATVARRVGQFEMKGQAEQQIAVLQQQIEHERAESKANLHTVISGDDSLREGAKMLGYQDGFVSGVHEYQVCKRGSREACEHIMLVVVASNTKFDVLYNEQGNYKKNAFELFERIEAQQAQDGEKQ
jgi:type II secretory pathway pseudopilin PulG